MPLSPTCEKQEGRVAGKFLLFFLVRMLWNFEEAFGMVRLPCQQPILISHACVLD